MAKIVTPSIRKQYKNLINQVVEDLNKPITLFLPPEKADCPQCKWDSINGQSSGTSNSSFTSPVVIFGRTISPNPFTRGRCPVCLGIGFLTNPVSRTIKALVKWNRGSPDEIESTPVGREGRGVVRLKVKRENFDLVNQAEYFLVDGVRCEVIRPMTIRGLGTQEELVVIFLQEVEVGSDVKK